MRKQYIVADNSITRHLNTDFELYIFEISNTNFVTILDSVRIYRIGFAFFLSANNFSKETHVRPSTSGVVSGSGFVSSRLVLEWEIFDFG